MQAGDLTVQDPIYTEPFNASWADQIAVKKGEYIQALEPNEINA